MFWDCHTHPQFSSYDSDREEMLARAREAGVRMIAVGTTAEDSEGAVVLAEKHPDVIAGATVGVHPTAYNDPEFVVDYGKLRHIAKDERVAAIGECGFDFFHADRKEVYERQRAGLVEQIVIANEVGKPLMIHCRTSTSSVQGDAFDDLIPILKEHFQSTASAEHSNERFIPIVHFFSGTTEHAKQLLELGACFTFGGVVTFTSDYDEQIKLIPKERILSETDAPFVAPVPFRGKRNEPAYVTRVVPRLAELKGLSTEKMKEQIAENMKRLFGLK